jgi:hypothetical protein
MVIFLVLFLAFVGVAAACWFQGLWTCAINVINITLAGLIATNFWEPLAQLIDENTSSSYTYMLDAPLLWALFCISYLVLRSITGGLSEYNVAFIKPVELAGRSILAIWCGWVFTCFAAFTMLTAPIGATPVGGWSTPSAKGFLFMAPERQWLSLAQSRSRGALSRAKFSTAPTHPEDAQANVETFDPNSEFTFKYHARRKAAEGTSS